MAQDEAGCPRSGSRHLREHFNRMIHNPCRNHHANASNGLSLFDRVRAAGKEPEVDRGLAS